MKKALFATAVIGGVALVGYSIYQYFIKQVALLKQFTWKIVDLKLNVVDLTSVTGNITFRFTSIADLEITVTNFFLDVYVNGDRVGSIEDTNTFIIPSKGTTDIPFQFTIDPQYVLKNIVSIVSISTKMKDAIVSFTGFAQIKSGFISGTVPINTDCSIKNLDCKLV